jgi:hypothetical protein
MNNTIIDQLNWAIVTTHIIKAKTNRNRSTQKETLTSQNSIKNGMVWPTQLSYCNYPHYKKQRLIRTEVPKGKFDATNSIKNGRMVNHPQKKLEDEERLQVKTDKQKMGSTK